MVYRTSQRLYNRFWMSLTPADDYSMSPARRTHAEGSHGTLLRVPVSATEKKNKRFRNNCIRRRIFQHKAHRARRLVWA